MIRPATAIALAQIIVAALSGCDDGTATPAPPRADEPAAHGKSIRFTDGTAASGIDMVMTSGGTPSREILEVDGGGLVLFDFDDDGDLDLFVANGATMEDPEHGPGSRLFRNDGAARFEDVTAASGISLTRWAMGATAGDYDRDGDDDLHVCCYGPNVLLRNDGGENFTDVSAAAGVSDDRWSTSCAFGDLDDDDDLDLYVVNYVAFDPKQPPKRARHKNVEVMAGPHGLVAQHDVLYENLGDGTFRDVTAAAGCLPPQAAYGLNVVIVDFDGDGRQDVLVGNDSMPNFHFRNLGPAAPSAGAEPATALRFEEIGVVSGIAVDFDGNAQATMGLAIADVDGNGHPDVFSTNFANDTNTLHMNADGRVFDDRTRQYGLGLVSRPFLGWGCAFFDWDHDGDEDLLMFNGHVYPEATVESMDSPYAQVPLLFERTPTRFERLGGDAAGGWLEEPGLDRCAAFGDLDRDGDVDAVVGALNGPVRVLLSEAADNAPDSLVVALRDDRPGAGNRRGLGARLELRAGATVQRRWLFTGGGFQSSSAHQAHFGRPAAAPLDETASLTVIWPDGHEQRIDAVEWGRRMTVTRDAD
jgi:hypothetical protein